MDDDIFNERLQDLCEAVEAMIKPSNKKENTTSYFVRQKIENYKEMQEDRKNFDYL